MKPDRVFESTVLGASLGLGLFIALILLGAPLWAAVGVLVAVWGVVALKPIRAVRARRMRLVRPGLRSFRFVRVRDLMRFCSDLEAAGYAPDTTVVDRYFLMLHEGPEGSPPFHVVEQIILVDDALGRYGAYARGSRGSFTVPPEPVLITYEDAP